MAEALSRRGQHLRYAVGAVVALGQLPQALAALVTLTRYSDAACTVPRWTTTYTPTTLPCCFRTDEVDREYVQFQCGPSTYNASLVRTTFSASAGDCVGTPTGQEVVNLTYFHTLGGSCASDGEIYQKVSAPLTCIYQSCPSNRNIWIPSYGYADGACATGRSQRPVLEYRSQGNDCYTIRETHGDSNQSEYVIKCTNGQYEQYRTTLLGCGGSRVEGSDVLPGSTEQNLLTGECTQKRTDGGVFAKSDSALLAVCATSTTTTTTDMPWGLPWWAWFLICCGITLCLVAIAGAAIAGLLMQRKPPAPKQQVIEETQYVVEDVQDGQPATTVAYPTNTYYPMTY